MRWVIPASVVVIVLGLLMLYVPLGKGAALIVPPQTPIALVLLGTIGIVVGVIRTWWLRLKPPGNTVAGVETQPLRTDAGERGRAANAAAVGGLILALLAVLAAGSVFVGVPFVTSLYGPDPCGGQFDTACFAAHPDYWHEDLEAGSWSPPAAWLSRTLDPIAWPAALGLALAAVLTGWLALANGTRRRRTALSALSLGSLTLLFMLIPYLGFLFFGGGD